MKTMLNKKIAVALIAILSLAPFSCKESFLEAPVTANLTYSQMGALKGIEGLLIGTYSVVNGRGNGWHSGASNWLWGSIRGGEANKGTNAGDFNSMNPVQRFEVDATNGEVHGKWLGSFEGVSRANYVLKALSEATGLTDAEKVRIGAQARFLRGHFYFELKKNFGNVPWIDETMVSSVAADPLAAAVKNDVDVWPKIEADFLYAFNNLPEVQSQVGRVNKWAAGAYLGKTYLFQNKFTDAKAIFDQVIANGKTSNNKKYGLVPNFEDVFSGVNENHEESVWAYQAASGTGNINNTNQDLAMNYPYNTGPSGPGECCGFFAPSFELINSYRTDANGLPLVDGSFRLAANELVTDQGVGSDAAYVPDNGNVDPRLDLSIGRRYVQFLDWMPHPGKDWIRDQNYAGPYTQKKYSYRKADKGKYQDGSSWTPGYHSINFIIIRYADVLLMAAEAEIEVGSLATALGYVNQVRNRAKNSAYVKGKFTNTFGVNATTGATDYKKPILDFTQNATTYVIQPYASFADQATARAAVRFERKLELALEGHRFYDLARWGVANAEINAYLGYEGKKLPTNLGGATFADKHLLLPIPQRQIDLQGPSVLLQNPGF